jgi:hypothetical protein
LSAPRSRAAKKRKRETTDFADYSEGLKKDFPGVFQDTEKRNHRFCGLFGRREPQARMPASLGLKKDFPGVFHDVVWIQSGLSGIHGAGNNEAEFSSIIHHS